MGFNKNGKTTQTVFGALSSIEGCEAFVDLVNNTQISNWFYSLKSLTEQHYGSKEIQYLF